MISYIRKQLLKEGIIWKSEKELFEMLVKDEPWEKYRSNWDSWKNQKVQYLRKSFHILVKISDTLGFDSSLWNSRNEAIQKEEIRKAIKRYKNLQSTIDLSDLMPPDPPVSLQQKEILEKIENIYLENIEKFLDNYPHFFTPVSENQNFLLKLAQILYKKGIYDFIDQKIFPSLLPHSRAKPKTRILMAHTFGSLSNPKYLEAAKLLETIAYECNKELIDLKTATISNLRREIIKNKKVNKEVIDTLKRHYERVYQKSQTPHYYPGINLAYFLKIEDILFNKNSNSQKIEEIFFECKESINEDKSKDEEARYYAWISEIEFMLLLEYKNIDTEIYLLLEELNPPSDRVKRTLRQLNFFINLIKEAKTPLAENFIQVKYILNSYLEN